MSAPEAMNRRNFMGKAARGLIAAGMSASVVRRTLGANDRINLGVIGCGRMGARHLRQLMERSREGRDNIAVIAVCDILEPCRQWAEEFAQARSLHDYRDMLSVKDLDGVWIAAPSHTHAPMAVDAMRAGKDVYLESPMAVCLEDARKVCQTALKTGRVVQVGSQECSNPVWGLAGEMIRAGKIGKVVWSQFACGPGSGTCDDSRRPLWSDCRPIFTDFFSDGLSRLLKALGPEFPCRVAAARSSRADRDPRFPEGVHMVADYPAGHSILALFTMAGDGGAPVLIRGHEGIMICRDDSVEIRREPVSLSERMSDGAGQPTRFVASPVADLIGAHHGNFIECMRTRKRPNCDIELAYRSAVACALGDLAFREKRAVFFDSAKEQEG